MAFPVVQRGSRALSLRGCSTQAPLVPHGMWDVPGTGIEPVSPAVQADSYPWDQQGSPARELSK